MDTRKPGLAEAGVVTVADIMAAPVRTVPPELSVAGLVRVLLADQITGAPVVDGGGRIVGVVSSSDVIRALTGDDEVASGDTFRDAPVVSAAPGASGEDPQETLLGYFQQDPVGESDRLPDPGPILADLTVADIMTPASFAIAPDATIQELAAFLTRGRIHRSLVVERGSLRGIVTSSDIVRLVAGDDGRERGEP